MKSKYQLKTESTYKAAFYGFLGVLWIVMLLFLFGCARDQDIDLWKGETKEVRP